ncbi:MAG: hypothetical protein IT473_04165 [Lysobacter sp.]|nr:hypothetical protein [Lysobacter sp.]
MLRSVEAIGVNYLANPAAGSAVHPQARRLVIARSWIDIRPSLVLAAHPRMGRAMPTIVTAGVGGRSLGAMPDTIAR